MEVADFSRPKVLVVDDETSICDSLKLLLENSFDVNTAANGDAALEFVSSSGVPDIVLLDVMMPGRDGLSTLQELRTQHPRLPIIMLTADNTVRTAVDAMKLGAVEYLNKPFEVDSLTELISGTLGSAPEVVEAEVPELEHAVTKLPEADFGTLVGSSPVMEYVFKQVDQIARRDITVLITGESGTGKELVARQIHERSGRAGKPFIPINCAAIPETLIESELFGHEKGSFTSATDRRIGHFERADGGTIFLDEIGELSLNVQVKMLRFLQEREFYRIGQSKPVRVDVRVVAATNKNLETLIKEKKFRQDLFYRINVVNVELPALRDRFEDIPAMAKFFVDKFRTQYGDRSLHFTEEAMQVLVEYPWPGNVRELENLVESLLALCIEDEVSEGVLPDKLKKRANVDRLSGHVMEGNLNFQEAERAFETDMIVKALKKTDYVQTRAAELLGISRRILKYKMDKLGISDKPQTSAAGEAESLPQETGHDEPVSPDPVPVEADSLDNGADEIGEVEAEVQEESPGAPEEFATGPAVAEAPIEEPSEEVTPE